MAGKTYVTRRRKVALTCFDMQKCVFLIIRDMKNGNEKGDLQFFNVPYTNRIFFSKMEKSSFFTLRTRVRRVRISTDKIFLDRHRGS